MDANVISLLEKIVEGNTSQEQLALAAASILGRCADIETRRKVAATPLRRRSNKGRKTSHKTIRMWREMRKDHLSRTKNEWAEEFGVSPHTVLQQRLVRAALLKVADIEALNASWTTAQRRYQDLKEAGLV